MRKKRPARAVVVALLTVVAWAVIACGGAASTLTAPPAPTRPVSTAPEPAAAELFPDILEAELRPVGSRTYDVVVTISSPYDSPERYADGWRVLAPDGSLLGAHELLHDHATEQPFTRTQPALVIPDGIDLVTVEGRDLANGYGGTTRTVRVPDAP